MKKIPLLTAKDVECRIQSISQKNYATLLLYKDARVDMKILDEVFGPMNWQRKHELINGNLFCTVLIWDAEKNQWIGKQDVGKESNHEAEKGQASDSFKRACFNVGIGRELYNAPFISIPLGEKEIFMKGNSKQTYTKFNVTEMEYDVEKEEFTKLTIIDNQGNLRYSLNGDKAVYKPNPADTKPQANQQANQQQNYANRCCNCGTEITSVVSEYSIKNFKQPLCKVCQAKAKAGILQ